MNPWQTQAYSKLIQKDYSKAIKIYEELIANEPDTITHYFYLGLLHLLQGQETEAQFAWMACITDQASAQQIHNWTLELVDILYTEAERQRANSDYSTAWLICQHLHEISPDNLNNLLLLNWLSVELKTLTSEDSVLIELIERLTELGNCDDRFVFNEELLWNLIASLLKYEPYPLLHELIESSLPFVTSPDDIAEDLINASIDLAYMRSRTDLAISVLETVLKLNPNHLRALIILCGHYHMANDYLKEAETAQLCCELSSLTLDKCFSNALLLKAFLNQGGNWQKAMSSFAEQQSLIASLMTESPCNLSQASTNRLYSINYFAPFIRDEAKVNRMLQNQISQLCQDNTNVDLISQMRKFRQRVSSNHQKLKIGYISHCMASHSVGWLARWLIRHHDRKKFELYGYFFIYRQYPDDLQSWYESQMDQVYRVGIDGPPQSDDVANKIEQDQIDILIDLDSLTLDGTCGVMARKPAPIQVTWLGWDASGIPTIDYFIADPYVLPSSAETYYAEKIWRLPQTYIAVDGFEVAVPSLRRDHLDIPADAVVYLSAQRGYKRHLDTARMQMQIIKLVPNSYFLIKGMSDENSIQELFEQIAIEEGVDPKRLRFLSITATESIHRANMGIADVVLDTYPYNGATTTLETLWMCIPMVTRVGQQFAARNSYTMMVNAGVSEGIAWSDNEYVEWGVRLGKDEALRQSIASRLKASRQNSPLWNAEKFTRQMEQAYEQMWEIYLQS